MSTEIQNPVPEQNAGSNKRPRETEDIEGDLDIDIPETYEELLLEFKRIYKKSKKLKVESEGLPKAISECKKQIEDLRNTSPCTETHSEENKKEIYSLQSTIEQLTKSLEEEKDKNLKLNVQVEDLKTDLEVLRGDVEDNDDKDDEIDNLASELQRVENERDEYQREVESLQEKIGDLEEELQNKYNEKNCNDVPEEAEEP